MGQLTARFDTEALRPPATLFSVAEWRAPPDEWRRVWDNIRQWCVVEHEARNNASEALSVARVFGGASADRHSLIESLCQDLDGGVRLAACASGLGRLWLRVATKFGDLSSAAVRRADHPWDCGYAKPEETGLQALQRFRPRRSTLIVIQDMSEGEMVDRLNALRACADQFMRRVRVLVVAEDDAGCNRSGPAPLTFGDNAD